jgi:hypothetical protein
MSSLKMKRLNAALQIFLYKQVPSQGEGGRNKWRRWKIGKDFEE